MTSFANVRVWVKASALLGSLAVMIGLVALPLTVGAAHGRQNGRDLEMDGPDLAAQWRAIGQRDENGKIDPNGLKNALSQRYANIAFNNQYKSAKTVTGAWSPVGANNIAGRTLSLAIDPTDTNIIWAGTAGGGLWKSTNGGSTWTAVGDRWKTLAVSAVVLDPTNHNTMYVGTGEWMYNLDEIRGSGIYKSTDGGLTFTQLLGTTSFDAVSNIAVSSSNPNLLLASVAYKGGGSTGGVYRSSDAGATWSLVRTTAYGATDVRFNPAGTQAIACVLDTGATYSIVRSTDLGLTWGPVSGGPAVGFNDRPAIAYAPSNGSIVYAVTGPSNGRVYRSSDGGATFVLQPAPTIKIQGTQTWYDNTLWVDPVDPNTLVSADTEFARSTDGGATWSYIGGGYSGTAGQPHPDVHCIVSHPGYNGTTNRTVFTGTDGGVFRSTDIRTQSAAVPWISLTAGQQTIQAYGLASTPSHSVLAGLQDNGTIQNNAGNQSAIMVVGGDGGFCAADNTDSNYQWGEYVYLQMYRTTDNWSTAFYQTTGLGDANTNANFIAPFALSKTNPNIMYAGGGSLWRSTNAKAATVNWSAIVGDPGDNISAIAIAPGNDNVVWVGYNGGRVVKVSGATTASPAVTVVDDNGATNPLPNRAINRIFLADSSGTTAYVGLGGYTANNLLKTTNGGATFTSISGSGATGLPSAPVRAFVNNPYDATNLFVGTEVGVFQSGDSGATWSTSSFGPNNAAVYELDWLTGTTDQLLAATHGRGIWKYTISSATTFPLTGATSAASIVGGNPLAVTATLSGVAGTGGQTVHFASDNTAAIPAFDGIVPAGSSSAVINVPTKGVNADTVVHLTASSAGGSIPVTVTVKRASLLKLVFAPTGVTGGTKTYGTVTLNGACGPTARTITLANPSSHATMPASVNIAAQASSAVFQATTVPVTSNETVTVTATSGAETKTGSFLIRSAAVSSVALNKTTMVGGNVNAVTVTLTGPAPAGGAVVTLGTAVTASNIPASLTVAAGATSASSLFTPSGVDSTQTGAVTATLGTSTKSLSFSLLASSLLTLTFSPNPVNGGSNTVGLLKLDGAAGPSGRTVALSESSAAVTMPASVVIPAGQRQVTFTVNTTGVDTTVNVPITAVSTQTRSGTLTVSKGLITTVVPTASVVGGKNCIVTISLSAKAGPSGTTFSVGTNNTHAVAPSTVTVPAGATSKSLTVTTTPVAGSITVQVACISATAGTAAGTFTLHNP